MKLHIVGPILNTVMSEFTSVLLIFRVAHFNTFLKELGVQTIPTDMSFGVSTTDGTFDWSSDSILSFIGSFSRQTSGYDTRSLCLVFWLGFAQSQGV